MRLFAKKTRTIILLGSLFLVILYTGLGLTATSVPAQAESSPTPEVVSEGTQPGLKSGDTETLIIGAGVILFIILSGVVIQRTLLKSHQE